MGNAGSMPWLGSAISSIGSLLGGLLGSSQQLKQQREAQKWNQHVLNTQINENAANRNFNAAQAELNRNFQSQMVDKANRFNSIENQVGQLRAAGLNPALAYSGNNFAPMSVPSGSSASASGNVSPGSYPIVDAATPTLEGLRQMAEIKNIEAQTRKLDAEGSILESDAKFRDAINQNTLDIGHGTILINSKQLQLTDEEISKCRMATKELESKIDLYAEQRDFLKVSIEGAKIENVIKSITAFYKSREYEATIDYIVSQTNKNRAEVKEILDTLPHKIANLKSSTALNYQLAVTQSQLASLYGVQITTEQMNQDKMQLDVTIARNGQEYLNNCGSVGQFMDGAAFWLRHLITGDPH